MQENCKFLSFVIRHATAVARNLQPDRVGLKFSCNRVMYCLIEDPWEIYSCFIVTVNKGPEVMQRCETESIDMNCKQNNLHAKNLQC